MSASDLDGMRSDLALLYRLGIARWHCPYNGTPARRAYASACLTVAATDLALSTLNLLDDGRSAHCCQVALTARCGHARRRWHAAMRWHTAMDPRSFDTEPASRWEERPLLSGHTDALACIDMLACVDMPPCADPYTSTAN